MPGPCSARSGAESGIPSWRSMRLLGRLMAERRLPVIDGLLAATAIAAFRGPTIGMPDAEQLVGQRMTRP